uniref:SymE family type I addiction module toxin n=1 Tax=Massilia sp. W12 TaxID=3126507 RepID=UPI00403F079B
MCHCPCLSPSADLTSTPPTLLASIKSQLRLSGLWLLQAGFTPGCKVSVHLQDGCLVIQRATALARSL